jgi:hypothetical protein
MIAIPGYAVANAVPDRILGLKIVSRLKSPLSANVPVTALNCIGTIPLGALRPNSVRKRWHMNARFRMNFAGIVNPRCRGPGSSVPGPL